MTSCQVNNRSFSSQQLFRCTGEARMQALARHVQTRTHMCTRSYISQENQLGAQSEKCRRCCGKYCTMFQRDGSQKKTASAYGFCSHLSPRHTTKISHIHTYTHTGERPISFRSLVCPLRCSSPLLLMIFLILRKETEVRGCVL